MRVDQYIKAVIADADGAQKLSLAGDDGETLTYQALEGRIAQAAAELSNLGLDEGERALLVGENTIDMVVALLAVIRLRAWAIPLNARMAPGEIDDICVHSEPALAYFSSKSTCAMDHASRFPCREPGSASLSGSLVTTWAGTLPVLNSDEGPAEEVAIMLYTSGTTGKPKGVMLTHGNLDFVTRVSMKQRAILSEDRIFHALPISHSFGLISGLLCALRAGAAVQFSTRFSTDALIHAIRQDNITVFQGVPAMYARLNEWADRTDTSVLHNHLRLAYIGGSQIDPTAKRKAESLLGLPLHHGYGMTEAAPVVTRTIGHPYPSKITAGWPIPGIEVVVRAQDGSILPAGDTGEVCVRGPNVMKGYFRDPEQTRAVIDKDGWLHTGDLGQFSADGDLTIVGRIKEMIIRSGFNVYPAEVEAAINAYPGVAQCAVIGHAEQDNEQVVAFIEPQAGKDIDEQELGLFLRGRIASYKIPSRWIVMEQLPASGTGKLLKPALKRMLEATASREVQT